MLQWISANIGTILISLVLLAVVALIIRSMVHDKKQGKSSCGGNCAAVPRAVPATIRVIELLFPSSNPPNAVRRLCLRAVFLCVCSDSILTRRVLPYLREGIPMRTLARIF